MAEVLKERFPKLKVFAVEPAKSPVLSGGAPGPHPIQGIGEGFVPKVLRTELLDGIIQVPEEESFGISSGESLAAVHRKLGEIPDGSRVLTFNYATGERYLSIETLFV